MSTPDHTADDAQPKLRLPKGVLCARCEHLNPPGSTVCESCQAKLFRACPKCGQQVQEALSRCPACGARLGGHHWHPHREARQPGSRNWLWAGVGLTVLLLAALFWWWRSGGNSSPTL